MTPFHPADPHFRERVAASFARQAFMAYLGARIEEVSPGYCRIAVAYRPELTQQHGYFHAGVIGALADNCAGYAAFSLMAANDSVLSVEYKLNLLAPGRGEELVGESRVIKAGRTLTVCRSDVFAIGGGEKTHCATALVTLITLADTPDSASRDNPATSASPAPKSDA